LQAVSSIGRGLKEVANVRQVPGEPRRRWFESPEFDLVVWYDAAGAPESFQLCYDKGAGERAVTWQPGTGLEHSAVDSGEDVGLGYKRAPTLTADGAYDGRGLRRRFLEASADLPSDIVAFVAARLAGPLRPQPSSDQP
jgi:hypothetical protein